MDERYSVAKKLSEDVEKELDKKYQPSIPVSENAPETPAADTLWVDKKNLRLKLWDGEQWQKVDAANSTVAASKSEMDKTAETLKAQINANVKASTDKNANYGLLFLSLSA